MNYVSPPCQNLTRSFAQGLVPLCGQRKLVASKSRGGELRADYVPSQMAEKYPNAEVRCLDPNPCSRLMPRNCTVERANLDEYDGPREWDFVFFRDSLVITHWAYFLDRLWSLAKIGGWVEIVDIERAGPLCTCGDFIDARTGLTCGRCEFLPPGDDRASSMAEAGFQFVRKAITSGDGRLRERYRLYW